MIFKKPVTILVIDDNSPFVLPLLRSFSGYPDIKLDVMMCSRQKPKYFRYSRFLRTLYKEEPLTDDNFEEIVKKCVSKSSADLIIPTREWISILIYQHRQELEKIVLIHPVSDEDTLKTINDKWKLNSWLKKNNFPFSNAVQFSKETEMNKLLDILSLPVLLKPITGIGGKGIKLINSIENLKSEISENEVYTKDYFIQEYIDGEDIDISFFAINGKILFYTIQKGIVSGQLTYSKGIEFVKNKEFFDLTTAIVSKLNFSGIAHLDFRFDSKRGTYILIDFNARYWSSLEGSRIMGVNFPLLAVAYSMGMQFNYPDYSVGTYYFATTAIKTMIRNLFSRKKYPVKLRNSELRFIFIDPIPEIVHTWKKIISVFHKRDK